MSQHPPCFREIGLQIANMLENLKRKHKVGAKDQSADLALSFQVLEHVRDLQTYFSEARRVLRQDGSLLLSTHGTWLSTLIRKTIDGGLAKNSARK